jgi:putative methionine-R-sulfoxide reductase with GAF domain
MLHNDTEEFKNYYNTTDLATAEIVAKIILNGGKVKITDIEEGEEPKFDFTLERLIVGIQKNAEERPWDCDLENYDATTCDCIIQYAVFDDVIFG